MIRSTNHRTRYAAAAAVAAALLAVGASLTGSASASAATIPAHTLSGASGDRFLLLIGNTPEEWIERAISEGPSVMLVERGSSQSQSQAVDNLIGCHEVADTVTIVELNYLDNEVASYTMHTACIVSTVNVSLGAGTTTQQLQDATFIFNSLTMP